MVSAEELRERGFIRNSVGMSKGVNARRKREHNTKLAQQYYPDVDISVGSKGYDVLIEGKFSSGKGSIITGDNQYTRTSEADLPLTTSQINMQTYKTQNPNWVANNQQWQPKQEETSSKLAQEEIPQESKTTTPYGLDTTYTSLVIRNPFLIDQKAKQNNFKVSSNSETARQSLFERKANYPVQESIDKYSMIPTPKGKKPYGLYTENKLSENKVDRFGQILARNIDETAQKRDKLAGKDTIGSLQFAAANVAYGGAKGLYNIGVLATNPSKAIGGFIDMAKHPKDTLGYFANQLKNQPAAFTGELLSTYWITKGAGKIIKSAVTKSRVKTQLRNAQVVNELERVEQSKPKVFMDLDTQIRGGGLVSREGQTIGTSRGVTKGFIDIVIDNKPYRFKVRSDVTNTMYMNADLNIPESFSAANTKIGSRLTKPEYRINAETKFLIEDTKLFSSDSLTGYGRELSVFKTTKTKKIKAFASEVQFKAKLSKTYQEAVPLVERTGFAEFGTERYKTPFIVYDAEKTFMKQTYAFETSSESRLVASQDTNLKKFPKGLYTDDVARPDYYKYQEPSQMLYRLAKDKNFLTPRRTMLLDTPIKKEGFKADLFAKSSGGSVQRVFEGYDYTKKFKVNGFDVEVKTDIPKSPDTVNFDQLIISRGVSKKPSVRTDIPKRRTTNLEPKLESEILNKKTVKQFFDDSKTGQRTILKEEGVAKAEIKKRIGGDPSTHIKRAGLEIGEQIKGKTIKNLEKTSQELKFKAERITKVGNRVAAGTKSLNLAKYKVKSESKLAQKTGLSQLQQPKVAQDTIQDQDQDQRQRQLKRQAQRQEYKQTTQSKQISVLRSATPHINLNISTTPKTIIKGVPIFKEIEKERRGFKSSGRKKVKTKKRTSPDLFSIANRLKGSRKIGTETGFTARLI